MSCCDYKMIDVKRIIDKLDWHLGRNDYESAEKHLLYWVEEAKLANDERALFSFSNELMGLYRKLGKKEEALQNAQQALELLDKLDYEDTVSAGTCYVNSATVYKAFGMAEQAVPLFEKARAIYEANLPDDDGRRGALYNNTALAMVDLGRFGEAEELFRMALSVMSKVTNGELEQAITYLNIADSVVAQEKEDAQEELAQLLDTAYLLLAKPDLPRDGYYAFVVTKCAPMFAHFGMESRAQELMAVAERIYSEASE